MTDSNFSILTSENYNKLLQTMQQLILKCIIDALNDLILLKLTV